MNGRAPALLGPLRLAVEAVVVSVVVRVRLRLHGTRRTILWARGASITARGTNGNGRRGSGSADDALVAAVDLAVRRVGARRPFRYACLPRSLATTVMLRRRGVDAVHRFGVRAPVDGVPGHAWVEVGGAPVGETAAWVAQFAVVDVALTGGPA